MDRRSVLRALGGALVAAVALPKMAWAAWSKEAFDAKESTAAMENLFGTADVTSSEKVKLKAPEIAENGAVVPLEVSTDMDAEQIAIFIDKNPTPLAISATMGAGAAAWLRLVFAWARPQTLWRLLSLAASYTALTRKLKSPSAAAAVNRSI